MRSSIIAILIILLFSCSSKEKSREQSLEEKDSTLRHLHIDWHLRETSAFKNLCSKFADTNIMFSKSIFHPSSSKFYTDTLNILDCKILNNLNKHRLEIWSSDFRKNYTPSNIIFEEWQFQNIESAKSFYDAVSISQMYKKQIRKPTGFLLKGQCLYVFQAANKKFIYKMETIAKNIDPELKIFQKTY